MMTWVFSGGTGRKRITLGMSCVTCSTFYLTGFTTIPCIWIQPNGEAQQRTFITAKIRNYGQETRVIHPRKSVASGPEFQMATLQSYISPEKSLKYRLQQNVGFNDWVCQNPAPSCDRTVLKYSCERFILFLQLYYCCDTSIFYFRGHLEKQKWCTSANIM